MIEIFAPQPDPNTQIIMNNKTLAHSMKIYVIIFDAGIDENKSAKMLEEMKIFSQSKQLGKTSNAFV